MFQRLLLAALLAGASSGAAAEAVRYEIDPDHTMVLASWSHLGFSHPSANFGGAHGTITFDPQAPEAASVQVAIPLVRLDTFVPKLDAHLKGPEFFAVDAFPEATFTSTSVRDKGDGRFEVAGDLRLKGVTRPVVLDVVLNKAGAFPMGDLQAIGFDATATLRRSDFGMAAGVPLVGDEVSLRITTEARAPR